MKTLCIYHANCADGFGAAWVVRKAAGPSTIFHPGVYQDAPPINLIDAETDIIMVDFSYKKTVMQSLAGLAHSIVIIDHHKSAIEDLNDFAPMNVTKVFDTARSGAGLTWDYFYPNWPRPFIINAIEDRDLWAFKFPNSKEINAAIFSYPYDFDVWEKLIYDTTLIELVTAGTAIVRKQQKDIAELLAVVKRYMTIGSNTVPVANLPYIFTSEAGHIMAEGHAFAACYWDTTDHRIFSLRSRDEGMDVSKIAAIYGGGGHKNAAGFRVVREHFLARL